MLFLVVGCCLKRQRSLVQHDLMIPEPQAQNFVQPVLRRQSQIQNIRFNAISFKSCGKKELKQPAARYGERAKG